MRSGHDDGLSARWDNVLAFFREAVGAANGGHLGPMLDLVAELRATPPACRLVPWTSHARLVVSCLPPAVFPQPHVWAMLGPATGRFEVGYEPGPPGVAEAHECEPADAGPLLQRLSGKLAVDGFSGANG